MICVITLEEAKASYPYRFTMEHVPHWATKERSDGTFYAPQYASDKEWYDKSAFPGENGIPEEDDHCESWNQTWPLGKSLKEPYRCEAKS